MMKPKKPLMLIGSFAILAVAAGAAIVASRDTGPKIMIITSNSSSTIGGTQMIITGSGFTPKGHTRVLVGNVEATGVEVAGPRTIIVTAPPAEPGTVGVTVINPDGRRTSQAESFTYSDLKPVITSISPDAGPIAGGFTVTLKGHGFRASDIRVKVDSVTVSPVVQDDANLTFTAPAINEAKQVNVAVKSADGVWSSDSVNLNYR